MIHIDFNKKIFWIIAIFVILFNALLTYKMYIKEQENITLRASTKAENLKNYFLSMRNIYHHQFLDSNIDVNESTVKLLPAYASTLISDKFAKLSKDGTAVRSVTDMVRNEKNRANDHELEAIEYFKKNRDKTMRVKEIEQNGKKFFNFTSPLYIEPYCLLCHGKKEETLPSIQSMYNSAYDYKVGDVRGVISIKIPSQKLTYESMQAFYSMAIFSFISTLFLLIIIYYVIRELTIKDVKQKIILENEVETKTAHLKEQTNRLQKANMKQQHLLSILRTVADCNEIIITATNIDELIQKTAVSIHTNASFASVKISIVEDGELRVKSSIGLDEDMRVLQLERDVFEHNHKIFLNRFDGIMPIECLEKARRYNVSEVYALPLRKENYAKKALGVMIVCSAKENGFSMQEKDIINELAGEIGFAINSLYQKDAINRLSYYDRLTNLPNQNLFEEYLKQAFSKSTHSLKYGAVFLLDFDDFKSVNDLMGKEMADEILKETAKRLISGMHNISIASRFGGDKFFILTEELSHDEKESAIIVKNLAQNILSIIKEPFVLSTKILHLTCSIGVALFFDNKIKSETILNQAEHALRVAKESGKNLIKFYDQVLQDMTNARSLMLQNLKEAVLKHEFVLYYQKQFHESQNVVGVEALIRWQHPELGFIPPNEFIAVAEESGIIKEIGFYVLNESANLIKKWESDEIKKEWRVSVNISPKQFQDESFVDSIKNLITLKNIDAKKLRIELTESVSIDNQESAMQKIDELKRFGVSISIDDFGTGYSSLRYLKNLNIDELKIDQSFVFGLGKNSSDKTIIKTIKFLEKFTFHSFRGLQRTLVLATLRALLVKCVTSVKKYKGNILDYLLILLALSLLPSFYYRGLYKKERQEKQNVLNDLDILNKQQIFFIRKMIHEMKTPLSAMELHLSIMAKEHCCTKSIAMIKSSARMLSTIYDDVAFHAGKEKICYPAQWIELEEFIADRVLYFDPMASVKNIFLDFHVESDFYIFMSRVELQRLIDNTLSNAIKYSKKSSEIVEIIITNDNDELNLIFRDKGIGMSEAEVQNLFKEYYRVSNNIQGLGLGMSIIKEICDEYGISIKVQSIKKEGSSFIYTIPKKIVKREVKNRGKA